MSLRWTAVLCLCFVGSTWAETLTLPLEARPDWLRQEGIVMVGDWDPLPARIRLAGNKSYTPSPEQLDAYRREQSPEMLAQLKALGANFVMMPCYKGFGLQAERESMASIVRFAALCRQFGLHVGVYASSGTLGWELMFKEVPQSRDWLVLDEAGQPMIYPTQNYRYYWNRNHPDAMAYCQRAVRFAIQDVKADLIHLDNYATGPGHAPEAVRQFREYLGRRFTKTQWQRMGVDELAAVESPKSRDANPFLRYAWQDFRCESQANSFAAMSRWARTLRPDILMECNPGGPGQRIVPPVDHSRLAAGGEAFWDEEVECGYKDGRLQTRIRSFKLGRMMNNMVFVYTDNPLQMAESMAFNLDCLGCICWFEYAKIIATPYADRPVSADLQPYIRFFRSRRELLRDAAVVADVAVLRSFASQVFADPKQAALTARAEQALIENRTPFQILYDNQLDRLKRYRVLVLAGCVACSDGQLETIRQFAASGGELCIVGPFATHDEWLVPREQDALATTAPASMVRIGEQDEIAPAIRQSCGNELSMFIQAPVGLCAELTDQTSRRIVHLVNYRPEPVNDVAVELQLPSGKRAKSVMIADPLQEQDTTLEFEQHSDAVTFRVPRVKVYAIAAVSWQ